MSSILKALKRIEENSPQPQTHPALPGPIASRPVLNLNNRKRPRRILYLFLMLLLVAVVAVMLFSQRRLIISKIMSVLSSESPTADEASDSSRTNVHRAKVPRTSAKPAQNPPPVDRRPNKPAKKVVSESREKKYQPSMPPGKRRLVNGTSPSQTAASTRKTKTSPNSRIKKPLKKGLPPPGPPPVKRAVAPKNTRPTAPAAKAKQPAKTRSRKTYDRITDSKLKLQALAWSDDAVRRMAVINGRIVHEGESVDGYQVVKIREEDVILNQGGKSWRLEFGLQQ